MNKEIIKKEDWYDKLLNDCRSIMMKTAFNSQWALIEGYWQLGKRISDENNNFDREKIYGEKIVSRVSESLGKSERTINRAIQFAWKYPVLDKTSFGKNVSWHKIVNDYLPEKTHEEDLEICCHEWETVIRCAKCHQIKE